MSAHFCLHTKRGRKAALKLFGDEITYWKGHLFLRAWEFNMTIIDDKPPNVNSSLSDVAFSVRTYAEPNYKQARMDVWMDDQGCLGEAQILNTACHEVLHIMFAPVTEGWEQALIPALDDDSGEKFDMLRPFLYGPEEGLAEDLAFILCEYRQNQKPRPKRKASRRAKKK